MDELRIRQSDLIDSDKLNNTSVCIIGVGGIGSHTALALARMGISELMLIDNDVVDKHNCSSQGFDIGDIGESKVAATAMKCFSAVRIMPKTKTIFVSEGSQLPPSDVYVLAVDSMSSRNEIFNAITENVTNATIINASMGAEYMSVDTYTGNTVEAYELFEKGFFTDEEASPTKCTAKATIYTTLLIAGFICKVIKDTMHNDKYVKRMVYDIANNMPVMIFRNDGNNLMD